MPDAACMYLAARNCARVPVDWQARLPPLQLGRGHGRVGHRRAISAYPASLISDARACASCSTSAFIASRVHCRPSLSVETPIANLFPLCIRIVHPFVSHHRAASSSPPSAFRIPHSASLSASTIRLALFGQVEILLALSPSEPCVVNTILHHKDEKKQTNDAFLLFFSPPSFCLNQSRRSQCQQQRIASTPWLPRPAPWTPRPM